MRAVTVLLLVLLGACATQAPAPVVPSHAVIGVATAQLAPDYWIGKTRGSRELVLSTVEIDQQNDKLRASDPTINDLRKLPAQLSGAQVTEWIKRMSVRPTSALFDEQGKPVSSAQLDEIERNVAIDQVAATQATRY